MKRYKHSLSNYKLLTCDMGKLVPVGLTEVLPGDSFQGQTSALIRLSPLVAPVMHPVTVRFHHWFVPNRILWDGWEDFITGGNDGNDASSPPVLGSSGVKGSLYDYLGVEPNTENIDVNALPIYAYNKIYNEFYRDEDLCPEVALNSGTLQRIAWEKDYFTSSRPWTQRGDAVTLPVGGQAPVWNPNSDNFELWDNSGSLRNVQTDPSGNMTLAGANSQNVKFPDDVYYADLGSAEQITINDFRKGFALQRYKEARARYGARYVEYLRYLGINPSDARLQRPEYLGGGKQVISFSEVLGTYDGGDTGGTLGQLGGHGISAMRTNRYRKYFEEHGYVMTLMSVRPKAIYSNGVPRHFLKTTKEDYYQQELEHIGQQEIWNNETFIRTDGTGMEAFSFQDRYSEYRHQPSSVAGDFRDTLNFWHMSREFATPPVLNKAFVECDATTRIFADQESQPLWCMVNHRIQARRMVKPKSSNRVI